MIDPSEMSDGLRRSDRKRGTREDEGGDGPVNGAAGRYGKKALRSSSGGGAAVLSATEVR